MPDPVTSLGQLARSMGVATRYQDGLGRQVVVEPETLRAVCVALGAPLATVADAADSLAERREQVATQPIPPVIVAWDGHVELDLPGDGKSQGRAELVLEDGSSVTMESAASRLRFPEPAPMGYHRIHLEVGGRSASASVIAAPRRSWHRPDRRPSWGVSGQLSAFRSARSRSVGDLTDLATLCEQLGACGGDVVNLLPLLPTFNHAPAEPSPYSPVTRLFWSELLLELGDAHRPVAADGLLHFDRADAEVRAALADVSPGGPATAELARYAAFRGAQKLLGRDWRRWPDRQRGGGLERSDIHPDEERFHLVAQALLRDQLDGLAGHLHHSGVRLGLDLAVGVHPEGYDVWARPDLFAAGMAVGAPPDGGFPSGQSWGFPPVLPGRSQQEAHAYFAASVAHQAALADVLRVDHVMAMTRLYWIPDGMGLADGTYVDYPAEELFAVLSLESHRGQCELVGENLGTVPQEIDDALARHRIWGMYLAEFEAGSDSFQPPTSDQVAMIGTHDTPLFAGWIEGVDIDERQRVGLLVSADVPRERSQRQLAVASLARALDGDVDDPDDLLDRLLAYLGASASPMVLVWLEDLWLETQPVNVPGSSSAQRPNWQRPMRSTLDDLLADPDVLRRLKLLNSARRQQG